MKRGTFLAIVTILIGVLMPLLLAEVALQIIGVYGELEEQRVNKENPTRRNVPNKEFRYTYGRFFELPNSGLVNNYGFLNDQAYDPEASLSLLAVIGDRFARSPRFRRRCHNVRWEMRPKCPQNSRIQG